MVFAGPACCRRVTDRGRTRHPGDDRAGIVFTRHEYAHDRRHESYALEASQALGVPPERVFKTLVAEVDGTLVVGVVRRPASLTSRRSPRRPAARGPG
jgi:prolyl-tRNA editing enzyme YbaK/EbsC (Cys-tRNA(Pro) deacylase)